MPTVSLNLDHVGCGSLIVDGANLSSIASGVSIVSAAGEATKITIDLGICDLRDIKIEGADLTIKGERIPESAKFALWEFLRKKYDQVEVTVLADDSRRFAIRSE
ncbi:hypothetical protein [uncultured Pseudomonas sp.]|uniref:hypothetical protein n=1 Tax=uncultured Pseudomonas sp. TaxID=114707 RepID=UPI0027DD73C5|nr:hypothetical protein [uncultured Pseudomonas sp.]